MATLSGLLAGALSGVFGIGGGVVLVPMLGLVLGLGQHDAQGMTLAILLLPVGLAAVVEYHRAGYVRWRLVLPLVAGFLARGLARLGGGDGGARAAAAPRLRGLPGDAGDPQLARGGGAGRGAVAAAAGRRRRGSPRSTPSGSGPSAARPPGCSGSAGPC